MELADPLFERLPKDQVQRVMIDQMADIAPGFLGFLDIYRALASIIPHHWTVIDLGCAYAPQSFLFEDHIAYIGVDFHNMQRFASRNTMHIDMSIEDFCETYTSGFNLDTTFAICSYVPPWGADNVGIARRSFKNVFTYYPAGSRMPVVAPPSRAELERSEG